MFRVEVHIDPPLDSIIKDKHAFVMLNVESESLESLKWFLDFVRERTVCSFNVKEIK